MQTNTSQQLWRNEFDRQYTREMLRDLVKRATALTKRYERYTPRRSTDTAEDRIHAAVMKLLDGARIWNPDNVDLCGFLLGVIASDLTSELRRAKLAPQISFDDRRANEDDYTGEPCEGAEVRASVENGIPVPLVTDSPDAAWAFAMTDLHRRAGTDARVLALLGAYEEGVYQKRNVMALLMWTSRTYRETYQRLLALAADADPNVREAISHALTN
jgi:hypothetical protein